MNRRDFVRFLALTAAGTAAKPEQIAAFEQYYEANTPVTDRPLVAVDEINLSGLRRHSSLPVTCDFYKNDRIAVPAAFNAFGGIFFWRAAPDQKIVVAKEDFFWRFDLGGEDLVKNIRGYISYIGPDKKRMVLILTKMEASIAECEALG